MPILVHRDSVTIMGTKRRTVISAEAAHVRRAGALVAAGRYRTLSDFVREAMDEKLARLEHELLADEVERYCAAGHGEEDGELIAAQAVEPSARSQTGRRRTRASR